MPDAKFQVSTPFNKLRVINTVYVTLFMHFTFLNFLESGLIDNLYLISDYHAKLKFFTRFKISKINILEHFYVPYDLGTNIDVKYSLN